MKNLKQLFLGAALALGTMTITMTSCSPDACDDVVCKNGGVCSDGNCQCQAGFTGSTCDHQIASKWVGTWACKDTNVATGGQFNYDAKISLDPNSHVKINVTSFGHFDTVNALTITQNTQDTTEAYLPGPVSYGGVDVSAVAMHISNDFKTIRVTYNSTDGTGTVANKGTWIRK